MGKYGLPRWLIGTQSSWQCRIWGFDSWVWEDYLEEKMSTHSSILTRRIPWTEEPSRLQTMGWQELYMTEWLCTHPHAQYTHMSAVTEHSLARVVRATWLFLIGAKSKISLWSEVKWKSLSHVQLFATPWTIQSMEFSRPEYWSG